MTVHRVGTNVEMMLPIFLTLSKIVVFIATAGAVFSAFKAHRFLSSVSAVVAITFAVFAWSDLLKKVPSAFPSSGSATYIADCESVALTIAEDLICNEDDILNIAKGVEGAFYDLESIMQPAEFATWEIVFSQMTDDLRDICGVQKNDCVDKILGELGRMLNIFLAESLKIERA